MINWRQKLSSRKFWALLAALAVSLLTAFGAGAETIEKLAGVIAAVGACIAYMLAEAGVDRAREREEDFLHLDGEEYDEAREENL